MDEVTSLKSENGTLKAVIENLKAEKTALDQLSLNSIKEGVYLRTQIILLNNEIERLKEKVRALTPVETSVVEEIAA